MKYQLSLTLLTLILFFFYSCSDDIIKNNGGNPTADFDVYLVKSKDTSYNMATYTVNSDGSNLKIFNDSLIIASKSRNGKILLAKVSNVNMITSIYYSNENGTNIIKIPFQQIPTYIDLSPDAAKVLFTVNTDASLDIANIDGSEKIRLSNNIFGTFSMPKFSPHGNKIAFLEEISIPLNGLYIIDPDGTNKKLLKDSLRVLDFYSLDWSPDGSKLVYHSNFGNVSNSQICIIDTSGSGYVILTEGINPAWSPLGDKICYLKPGNMGAYDINIMYSDGTGITNISYSATDYDIPGKWSKDGAKILYSSQVLPFLPRLFVYDLNSSSTVIIADSVFASVWK